MIGKLGENNCEDIYNFDKTALFYRMEPDLTLGTKRKKTKRINLGFFTNSPGSDKLMPLVIWKFKNPCCLKGVNLQNIGISLKIAKKAWISTIIFQE